MSAETTKAPHGGLRIYSSLSRELTPLVPLTPGHVRMYVCGMTTYDYCHIGHARAMITFDVVYRHLLERGYAVTYVRNHTDVDDKIIARAIENNEDPLALSQRFIVALDEDLARLGLRVPTAQPKVSESIPEIIELVGKLIERGHAYAAPAREEGLSDVYFAVESFEGYGKLSGKRLADLRAGERVDVDSRKRHPGDFALWKAAKTGEVSWESPWGAGRPGWHIECSAMSMAALGEGFDIHGGGIDLIFPHHENEIAQSECGTGHAPYAKVWMHNGHLTMGEAKMSKSLGNIVRIRDILDAVPAEALRLLYLEAHYRGPLPWSSDRLTDSMVALDRLYHAKELIEGLEALGNGPAPGDLLRDQTEAVSELIGLLQHFEGRFLAAMDDDFNTVAAITLVHELVRSINRYGNNKKLLKKAHSLAAPAQSAFAMVGRVLGIGGGTSEQWFREVRVRRLAAIGKTEAEIQSLIDERLGARAAKDWARADELRLTLDGLGVVLMDGPEGTRWRMRVE
jgi:cysteinyl-tRNA synthetase